MRFPLLPRFLSFFWHLRPYVLRHVAAEMGRLRLFGLSSEIAFDSMLAMFPAIIAALSVLGRVFPERAAFDLIADNLKSLPPQDVQTLIDRFVDQLQVSKGGGVLSLSFIAALWIASSAVSSTMNALDRIHRISHKRTRPFWKAKLISLTLTLGSIVLLAVASFLAIISDFIVQFVVGYMGEYESNVLAAWHRLSWPLALVLVAIAFAFVYRFGPSRWKPGIPVFPGAAIATLLWAGISSLFRLYVSHFGRYNVYYGAVGTAIVMLLWLKLSSLALLVGAQLNVSVGHAMRRQAETRRMKRLAKNIGVEEEDRSV
ncbi:YihY/virulence factor BrkB family protein [Baaleninema simplex]|uniref:YihY/virulence factor BrkB family protein n=1 Tax=Baaleninema simplex TaxID=2862350 RepID=UPI00034CD492|nr:YihY/virulence factor BrkB family protein [Baaleninema simplex]